MYWNYRHSDKNQKKGYHATMLEVSVLHQSLALFYTFAEIIIRIRCCVVVEMFCTSYQFFSERNLFELKSFENIREGLV